MANSVESSIEFKKDKDADFAKDGSNEEVVGKLKTFCFAVMTLVYVEQATTFLLSTEQQ